MTDLATLNAMSAADFVAALAGVFEHAPWVAEAAAPGRPYADPNALFAALQAAVERAPDAQQLQLLRNHPDLAGKAALAGDVTAESLAEQGSAGLDRLSPAEFEAFQKLNAAYADKFGFPFIVCVRRHTKDSILAQFERRLAHDAATERHAALAEVGRIAALRLNDLLGGLPVAGRLSTHVLDTHAGTPAAGMALELVELAARGESRILAQTRTNADGRTDGPLIGGRPVPIGRYELRFHVADYYRAKDVALADPPFLDVVPLRFAVAEPDQNYHVPLLVTPWSYSTYRGS
jgi:2-oxo-4-hydroxy-4-carboxy-5-ureidoimidazoline decarboxylase